MARRGCSIGALPRRTKIIVGVGLAVAAAGLGYVVYRATSNSNQRQGSGYPGQGVLSVTGTAPMAQGQFAIGQPF